MEDTWNFLHPPWLSQPELVPDRGAVKQVWATRPRWGPNRGPHHPAAPPDAPHSGAERFRIVIQITTLPRACSYIGGMLRRIIQKSTFPALLGMAATYALTAILAALLAADSLARNSIVMPQLLD